MKKLLGILILGLLWCNISFANDNRLEDFNQWLLKNEHTQYLEIKKDFEECKDCTRWDAGPECFEEIGKPKKQCVLNGDQSYGEGGYKWVENFKHKNNLDIRFYKSSEIPWEAKPNKDTLLYYLFRYLDVEDGYDRAGSKGTKTPHKFKTELRDDKIQKYVNKHMQKTALLSYLLYEDGKITIDEISPKDRFGILYNNNTQFTSASVGKSLVSYVAGHAICEGFIDGVDEKLNDWPLLKNTLFYDQKLIDLLNMAAGYQEYADNDLKTNKYRKNGNANTVEFHMQKGVFKNSKKTKKKYVYTNVISNIVINYVWFKSNGKFQYLLDKIFRDKAKIENDVWFMKMNDRTIKFSNRNNSILKEYKVKDEDGPIRYSFRASRYDYLRIAKAMLDDWQNDTCVGKYLKTIHERRIPKNNKWKDDNSLDLSSRSYAGHFHTNFSGISSKKRNVMGMSGYGGQSIMIDFDKGRINVINSMHQNYNWKKIAHSVIKKGK
jgi:hypothetical protein